MNINTSLLKSIIQVYGPASDESKIRDFIKDEIKDYVDDISIDTLGSLIAHKKGKGKKIMISSHMDQIGLMVTDIDKNGFIRFTNVGGVSPDISLSQKVIFKNGVQGVIFTEPLEGEKKHKLENMYIDIGVFSKEDAEAKVNIGDICIYDSEPIVNDNVVFGPYLDDRIGCYISIEAIKNIKETKNDLYFVFSVQEEVGLRGARTAAYSINPDLGISLDVTSHGDTPKAKRFAIGLNKGAAIKVKDNSLISHPKIKNTLIELAENNGIGYQMEVLEFGGTDSGAIHLTKSGIPSGVISIPTRYVHSTVEMASLNDVNNCMKLLIKFLDHKFDNL